MHFWREISIRILNTNTGHVAGIPFHQSAPPPEEPPEPPWAANIIYIGYKFITTNVWLSIIRNLFSSKAPLIYYLGSTKWTATAE